MHYHGHVYYRNLDKAREAHQMLGERSSGYLFPLERAPLDLTRCASFGMAFGTSWLVPIRQWMQQNRNGWMGLFTLSCADDILAHTTYAEWIGRPLPLEDGAPLFSSNKTTATVVAKAEQQPSQADINSFEILHLEDVIGECTMGAHYQHGISMWQSCRSSTSIK